MLLRESEEAISEHANEGARTDKHLIAYLVATDTHLEVASIRDYLSQTLPEYMLPKAYVLLEVMPLTVNGKIDRKALLAKTADSLSLLNRDESIPPRNAVEWRLAAIWSDLLNVPKESISVEDGFFIL